MKRVTWILWILLSSYFLLPAQQSTFVMEGIVYDDMNTHLPGVTVYLRDNIGVGTTTNIDGEFNIRASRGDMIVFTFVGYERIEYLVTQEEKDLEITFSE